LCWVGLRGWVVWGWVGLGNVGLAWVVVLGWVGLGGVWLRVGWVGGDDL